MVAKRIQGDYDCLQEMMKLFMRHADMTVALTFQVEGLVDQLQGGAWRGVGAEAFFAEMHEVIFPAMRKLEDALQFAGEGTGKIHHILREAEEEAARLFRGEGEPWLARSTPYQPDQHPAQQGNPCDTNPFAAGTWPAQTFDAAKTFGIDPVLLLMLITNEGNNKSPEDSGDYGLLWSFPFHARSFGRGEVSVYTAMSVFDNHPDLFQKYLNNYPKMRDANGKYSDYDIGWAIYDNDEFNTLVAAAYVKQLEAEIAADLGQHGITITDTPSAGPVSITTDEFRKLVITGYNTGWSRNPYDPKHRNPDYKPYHESLQNNSGALDVQERLRELFNKYNKTHVDNVTGLQRDLESKTGLRLGQC